MTTLATDFDGVLRQKFLLGMTSKMGLGGAIESAPPPYYMLLTRTIDPGGIFRAEGHSGYGPYTEVVDEAGELPEDSMAKWFPTELYPHEFGKKETVTLKAVEDARNNGWITMVQDKAQALGSKARDFLNDAVVNFFAYAHLGHPANLGLIGGDGQSLISASHQRSATDATTWSNHLGAVTLNDINLEAARVASGALTDPKNQRLGGGYNLLVVGRLLAKRAWELVYTDREVSTANNKLNWFGPIGPMGYRVVILDELGGYNWFLCNPELMARSLITKFERQISFEIFRKSPRVFELSCHFRVSTGYTCPHWALGSSAAS